MRPLLLRATLLAALLVPAVSSAQDACPPFCSDVLCAAGDRGALEVTLLGTTDGAIEATINRVYDLPAETYQAGDTIQVPAGLGFVPSESVLLIVGAESGEILGAARIEGSVVDCGRFPTVDELVPLALADDCVEALAESGFDVPECPVVFVVDDDDDIDSGCAFGCGAGVGFLAVLALAWRLVF